MKTRTVITALLCSVLFDTSALAVTPLQVKKIEQYKELAVEYIEKEQYSQAESMLMEVLAMDPGNQIASLYLKGVRQRMAEPYCKKADEAFNVGAYERAISIWKKILVEYPDDIRSEKLIEMTQALIQSDILEKKYEMVDAFLEEDNYESAVNELEKILQIKPDETLARDLLVTARQELFNIKIKNLYARASEYLNESRYELAIAEWEKILALDGEQEEASRLIAMAKKMSMNSMYSEAREHVEKGDYVRSREIYSKVLRSNPTDEELKQIVGRLSETIKIVQKLEGEDPYIDMLRKALANHVLVNGDPKVAVAAAWYAEQLDPESELTFSIRMFLERKHILVFRSMEQPIRDMNLIDQYLFAALNHIYEGRYDLAVEKSSIVIALQPKNTLGYKRLGSAFYAMGEKTKALEAWEKALSLAPDDTQLKQFIKGTQP